MTNPPPSPSVLAEQVSEWLVDHDKELAPLRSMPESFDDRVANLQALQKRLYDAGWALYGWPEEIGGRGGSELHRAAMYEALAYNGYPPRVVYEHVDIILPALLRYAEPELARGLVHGLLSGEELWCQGFSEPGAGSDLASLRTKAVPVDGGFRVQGHKIWTSWAKFAKRCVLLARTGSVEERHRGLTMFVVDVDSEGWTSNIIRQANGTDELAEVFFDDVFVDESRLIGEVGQGWEVAMYLLSCERGSYAWQRQAFLVPRLEALAAQARGSEGHEALGDAAADLFAVRVRSWSIMRDLAAGREPGPESAVSKLLITESEKTVYDAAKRVLGSDLETGLAADAWRWQEEFLFSRATSIYGGTRQIQLTVIARHLLGREGSVGQGPEGYDAYVDSVTKALKDGSGREVLDAMGWWDVAGGFPADEGRLAFGALFEGQGRELALGPALGAVVAAPVLGAAGETSGLDTTFGCVARSSDGSLRLLLAPAATDAERFVAYCPQRGWGAGSIGKLTFAESGALDTGALLQADLAESDWQSLGIAETHPAAARAIALGRIAICFEILGASRVMLEMATEHAAQREQFGRPIAQFQAVQHLLAEGHVELTALREICYALLACESDEGLVEAAALAKIRAGRGGRTVAQRSLQVLGAIGFTDEHKHHLYSRRVMTLDVFLGGGTNLAAEIGAQLVESRCAPRGVNLADLPDGR